MLHGFVFGGIYFKAADFAPDPRVFLVIIHFCIKFNYVNIAVGAEAIDKCERSYIH